MSQNKKRVVIIGSGFGSLSAAGLLAKKGYEVSVYEKNERFGGRANLIEKDGFVFDMGPSWYMMPEIFEHYFSLLGEDIHEYLDLEKLDPSYRIFLAGTGEHHDVFGDRNKMADFFESREKGAGKVLIEHLDSCGYQYEVAKREFMFKNYNSIFDLFTKRMLVEGRKLPLFRSIQSIVHKKFTDPLLRKILLYQMVFLGTAPKDTPGIYSLMNHVDIDGAIWYPQGGMYELVKAFVKAGEKYGVTFHNNSPVQRIVIEDNKATGIELEDGTVVDADIVISNADLAYTDTKLVSPQHALHSDKWWDKRKMTPSAFLMYLGIKGKEERLQHHNLVFSDKWDTSMSEVFDKKEWPKHPSIYVSCPSKTDNSIAPEGHENVCVLVPVAYDLDSSDEHSKEYGDTILDHLAKEMQIPDLKERVVFRKDYSVHNFAEDYNAYKGNALGGLAHTLLQSAFFRPDTKHPKVEGLYFAGAGTNPGIGVPICVISGELVYKRIEGIETPEPLESLEEDK